MRKKQSNGRNRKSVVVGAKEKRRLFQLALCVVLFLVMLIGHGNEDGVWNQNEDRLFYLLSRNTDFAGAFSDLGRAVAEGDSLSASLTAFGEQLLGLYEQERADGETIVKHDGPAVLKAKELISTGMSEEAMLGLLGIDVSQIEGANEVNESKFNLEIVDQQEDDPQNEGQGDEMKGMDEEGEQGKSGTSDETLPSVQYDGPALPANATMEYYDLGLSETETPVMGELSSAFGYRIHPMSGESSFHAGVDIAADLGTPIVAFADGVVEYIGESEKYGLYIQVDHGNGIKSFYCHCNELMLGKGKGVTVGQTIALVGDTGDTTGSHLHLELKRNDILINPIYYIETIS